MSAIDLDELRRATADCRVIGAPAAVDTEDLDALLDAAQATLAYAACRRDHTYPSQVGADLALLRAASRITGSEDVLAAVLRRHAVLPQARGLRVVCSNCGHEHGPEDVGLHLRGECVEQAAPATVSSGLAS